MAGEKKMKEKSIGNVLDWLEEKIGSLKDEVEKRDSTINSLQKIVNDLKNQEENTDYKQKFDKITQDFQKEKQDLTSLKQERNDLQVEVKHWRGWFDSNKDLLDKLLSAAPPQSLSEPQGTTARPKMKIKLRKNT